MDVPSLILHWFASLVHKLIVFAANHVLWNSIVAQPDSTMLSGGILEKQVGGKSENCVSFFFSSKMVSNSWYLHGNGLKSANWLTPGHVSSVGVPSNLKIRFNWSSTSDPGNSGRPAFASSWKKRRGWHITFH